MKRTTPVFLVALVQLNLVQLAAADLLPSTLWFKQFGTVGFDYSTSIAVDDEGSIYFGGRTEGSLFGTHLGGSDAIAVKLNSEGDVIWGKQFGSSRDDEVSAVAVNGSSSYWGGHFEGPVFGMPHAGRYDGFMLELDEAGDLQSQLRFGTSDYDEVSGIAMGPSSTLVVSGLTRWNLFGSNSGLSDSFVASIGASGEVVWSDQYGTSENDPQNGVTTDLTGNTFSYGLTYGDLDGTNSGFYDGYLLKYDPQGSELWRLQIGTTSGDRVDGVVVDSDGNAYITGTAGGALGAMEFGSSDGFVMKVTADGNIDWIQQLGTEESDWLEAIILGDDGNLYAAGHTRGSLAAENLGGSDVWLASLNLDGEVLWNVQFGSELSELARSIAIYDRTLYLTGNMTPGAGSNSEIFVTAIAVPESSTLLLCSFALGALLIRKRVRKA